MRHRPRVYVRHSRLRVGLGPGVRDLPRATGHGGMWSRVLVGLEQRDDVRLVGGRRADVWLADGHAPQLPDGRPLVVQVHEASWGVPELRRLLAPEFAAGISEATQVAIGAADAVITPSRAAARQVLELYGGPPGGVHPVAHGVDHAVFRPAARHPATGSAPYVLFVGVLHPRKNLDAVRAAVAGLADAGAPHRLVIVGNPAPDPRAVEFERAATAPLPGHPDRILHLRDISEAELAGWMAGAAVFCLPSLFEGFGLPALEAMACGAPVVVSDRGALPEVVGGGGLVVAPDPAAVSQAVARVVADAELAGRLRRAALGRAAGFSWARTAAGWLEVLQQVAGRR